MKDTPRAGTQGELAMLTSKTPSGDWYVLTKQTRTDKSIRVCFVENVNFY